MILSSTNACSQTDTLELTIYPVPNVFAGADKYLCYGDSVALLNGSIQGGATKGIWHTTGTGTFEPTDSSLNATYVLASTEGSSAISIWLTSVDNNVCAAVLDTMQIQFTTIPVVAVADNQTICANQKVVTRITHHTHAYQ